MYDQKLQQGSILGRKSTRLQGLKLEVFLSQNLFIKIKDKLNKRKGQEHTPSSGNDTLSVTDSICETL